ncbi:MAG: thermonuclease family protein [Patescibacteria group bacterium]
MAKLGKIIIGLILGTSIGLNLWQWQENKNNPNGYKVEGVIDGDTLVLEGNAKIRLRGVDAPELKFCGGEEAKKELEKLVNGKTVEIREKIMDLKARPMALVYSDNILVNKKMIESGWAKYHSDVISKRQELKTSGETARENKLGIWSEMCRQTENKAEPKCKIKGNIDDNARSRKIYYYPGCAQYEFTIIEKNMGEEWFYSKEKAEAAGYQKSKNCKE